MSSCTRQLCTTTLFAIKLCASSTSRLYTVSIPLFFTQITGLNPKNSLSTTLLGISCKNFVCLFLDTNNLLLYSAVSVPISSSIFYYKPPYISCYESERIQQDFHIFNQFSATACKSCYALFVYSAVRI